MSVYGGLTQPFTSTSKSEITLESFISEAIQVVDETYSVVYEEYCNYKQLMESCTDETERSLLESKVELLHEVSMKDVINKIKEIWTKFKNWIKDLFKEIFNRRSATEAKSKILLKKAKDSVNKAKSKGITESTILEESEGVTKPKKEVADFKLISKKGDIEKTCNFDDIFKETQKYLRTFENVEISITRILKGDDPNQKLKMYYMDRIEEGNLFEEIEIVIKYIKDFDLVKESPEDTGTWENYYDTIENNIEKLEKVSLAINSSCREITDVTRRFENCINSISSNNNITPDTAMFFSKICNKLIVSLKNGTNALLELMSKCIAFEESYDLQLKNLSNYLDSITLD